MPGTPQDKPETSRSERSLNPEDLPVELRASLYNELRRIAGARMRLERRNHTLQPTALVHEVCLKFSSNGSIWQDRSRLLRYAAHQMRQIWLTMRELATRRGAVEGQFR